MIELWAILAIGAAILIAFTNLLDKILLNKYLNSNELAMSYIFRLLIILPIPFFFKMQASAMLTAAFAVLGLLYTGCLVFYMRAINAEEVTRVMPLFGTSPLFVMLLSAIFLHETLSTQLYVGIGLIVFGILLLSYHIKEKHHFNLKSVAEALAASILYSVIALLIKQHITLQNLPQLFFAFVCGSSISLSVIWVVSKRERTDLLGKLKNWHLVVLMLINHALILLGYAAHFGAITLGQLTLATTLYSSSPFFLLIFTTFASVFFNKFVHEDISKFTIIQKIVAIAITMVGLSLVL